MSRGKYGGKYMKKIMMLLAMMMAATAFSSVGDKIVLWKDGDNSVAKYRIPALCTAPNGDLVAVCDARTKHGGDLNRGSAQMIYIACRRSTDAGKTWTESVKTWDWPWTDTEQWVGSDPSLVVDQKTKTIFLFYNVGECKKEWGAYKHYVQESKDNGVTWSKPRDISLDIRPADWPKYPQGFVFITSGSGIQTKDGTLLHTLVNVGRSVALFGSTDHGKTWKSFGNPTPESGDECKVVELSDGTLMINSRRGSGQREIFTSIDGAKTWSHRSDTNLLDPACNAQIMRLGKVLLFSNCKSRGRNNLYLRASIDDGASWTDGISICSEGAAYSDITLVKDKKTKQNSIGVIYEGAGYSTINFTTVPLDDIKAQLGK